MHDPYNQKDFSVYFNSINKSLHLKNMNEKTELIQVFDLSGRRILQKEKDGTSNLVLEVPTILSGIYIINLKGESYSQSKTIFISK